MKFLLNNFNFFLDYTPIGPRFSNLVLQALLVLLSKQPPPGHRLLVLATSSAQSFLQEVDLISRFSKVIRIRQLRHLEEIIHVCQDSGQFSDEQLSQIKLHLSKIEQYVFCSKNLNFNKNIFRIPPIGIKSLLEMLDFVRVSDSPVEKLVEQFSELSLGI